MGSRLQLVLEALEGMVGALVHDPSLELLASALAPPPAGEEGAAAAGLLGTFEGRLDVCRDMLTERLLPLARRLAACDSHGEAEVAVRVAAKISAVLPGPSLGGVLEWAGGLCEEDEVASDKLARQLLGFYLHLDQRAHVYGLGRALSMAQRLHDLDSEPEHAPPAVSWQRTPPAVVFAALAGRHGTPVHAVATVATTPSPPAGGADASPAAADV